MTWRAERKAAAQRLRDAGIIPFDAEARFLVEEASGYDADDWLEIADVEPPTRPLARLHDMIARRVAGEPLQYVMGHWSFRTLDLAVDRRVLIPRPETEFVVEVALEEATRLGIKRSARHLSLVDAAPKAIVADLGTGSGAIALALEAELPEVEVWATDNSDGALDVARANVAGCAATRVRLAPVGSWFDALPHALRGNLALVVSNPPYIAMHEVKTLPNEVIAFEPWAALIAGQHGTEALELLLRDAGEWLIPGGSLVLELAPHQARPMAEAAHALGYSDATVRDDLAGRPRVLVARTG